MEDNGVDYSACGGGLVSEGGWLLNRGALKREVRGKGGNERKSD